MKLDPNVGIISEGKLLELIPVIMMADGSPLMLPPTVYHVPNWLLGFQENHWIGMPISLMTYNRVIIPGSSSSSMHSLQFLVRLMEDTDAGVDVATVDAEAVRELLKAIKEGS